MPRFRFPQRPTGPSVAPLLLLLTLTTAGLFRSAGPASAQEPDPQPVAPATAAAAPAKKPLTPAEANRARLQKTITVEFENTPLNSVVDYLATAAGVNIVIDQGSLDEEGIHADAAIRLPELTDLRIEQVLDLALAQHGLEWDLEGDVVVVMTEIAAEERFTIRMYDVGELLAKNERPGAKRLRSTGTVHIGAAPYPNYGRGAWLVDLIQKHTNGPWWDIEGVGGNITILNDVLMVRHYRTAHDQVEALLNTLGAFTAGELRKSSRISRSPLIRRERISRIREALSGTANVHFQDAALPQVTAWFSQRVGVPLIIAPEDRADNRPPHQRQVSIMLTDVPLESALRLCLGRLGHTFTVQDGYITVWRAGPDTEPLQTVVHDVTDILSDEQDAAGLRDAIQSLTKGPWQENDGIGGTVTITPAGVLVCTIYESVQRGVAEIVSGLRKQAAARPPVEPDTSPQPDPDGLVTRIYMRPTAEEAEKAAPILRELVASESWKENGKGGKGVIRVLTHQLIIRQTPAVHRELGELFDLLDQIPVPAQEHQIPSHPGQGFFNLQPEPAGGNHSQPAEAAAEPEIPGIPADIAPTRLRMQQRVTIEFDEQPLDHAISALAEKTGLNIVIDRKTLAEEGVAVDKPVSGRFRDARLEYALDLLLEPLELSWRLEPGVVVITTEIEVERNMETRLFNVAPLIKLAEELRNDDTEVQPQKVSRQRKPPRLIPVQFRAFGPEHPPADTAVPSPLLASSEPDADWLIDIISNFSGGGWHDLGGPGDATMVGDVLCIRQERPYLDQATWLLIALHRFATEELKNRRQVARSPFIRQDRIDAIHSALQKPIDLELIDTPLREAVRKLEALLGIRVVIDEVAFAEDGIADDEPVDLILRQVSLQSALTLILDRFNLTSIVGEQHLLITTKIAAEGMYCNVVHDVRDLQAVGYGGDALTGAITSQIDETTWQFLGGDGRVEVPLPGLMIVRQSAKGHAAVDRFLAELRQHVETIRRHHPERLKPPEKPEPDSLITRVYRRPNEAEAGQAAPILRELIAPASWSTDDGKGRGLIHVLGHTLIIRQPPAVHRQIEQFFHQIDTADAPP